MERACEKRGSIKENKKYKEKAANNQKDYKEQFVTFTLESHESIPPAIG